MPLTYNKAELIGTMKVMTADKRNEGWDVLICKGNCMAVFVIEDTDCDHLYFFLADKEHGKRIMKDNHNRLLGTDDVRDIRLNMYYKECHALLDLMVKSGYKVECYYKEPKKRKEANNVRK